jgi:hypothetical protein
VKKDSGYIHFFLTFVHVRIRDGAEQIVNFTAEKYAGKFYLSDLYVWSQFGGMSYEPIKDISEIYAHQIEYREVFAIDQSNARPMADTLDAIQKKLDAINQEDGYPAHWAQYALRVCKIVGAKELLVQGRTASSYSDMQLKRHKVTDLEWFIRDWITNENKKAA